MLLNPAFMYAAIWSFVLFLYALRLSLLLEPLRPATIVLVIGTSVSFIFGWAIESLPSYGRLVFANFDMAVLGRKINSSSVEKRLRFIWILFFVGSTVEVAIFHGAPGLGLLGIGPAMSYMDYGIHGYHGLMNALYFAACAVQFARILLGSSTRSVVLIVATLAYPFLTMSREVFVSDLLQYLFIYFAVKRPSLKVFVRAGVFFVVTFLFFGYLGDLRSGRDAIIALGSPSFDYPEWLPSAFIWFYIYLCTPLNNVNYNIDITPNYFPIETAGTLIPSFARDSFLSSAGGQKQWDLVSETFNVSSLLQSLLTDFGVAGSIAFTLLLGAVFSRVLRRSVDSASAFFIVIILLHGIALSFFANLLFNLISVFEMFIAAWLMAGARRI